MDTYTVVATLRSVLFSVVLLGLSQPLMAQDEAPEGGDSEHDALVFKAQRSHVGGSRSIPVELSLGGPQHELAF